MIRLLRVFCVGLFVSLLSAGSSPYLPVRVGPASYYSPKFHGKCCTTSGEKINIYAMTAAHRSLPLGSYVRVTNTKNKRAVVVRINDRGPYYGGRIIDLSTSAFKQIANPKNGVVQVKLDLISLPRKKH